MDFNQPFPFGFLYSQNRNFNHYQNKERAKYGCVNVLWCKRKRAYKHTKNCCLHPNHWLREFWAFQSNIVQESVILILGISKQCCVRECDSDVSFIYRLFLLGWFGGAFGGLFRTRSSRRKKNEPVIFRKPIPFIEEASKSIDLKRTKAMRYIFGNHTVSI